MPYIPAEFEALRVPNPKTDRHYRWLDATPKKLAQWLLSFSDRPGYRLIPAKEAEELGFNESFVDKTRNRIAFGDLVLADIPQTEYDRRRAEIAAAGRDRREAPLKNFLAQERPGIKPRLFEMDEVKDLKAFHSRESTNRVGWTPSPTDDQPQQKSAS